MHQLGEECRHEKVKYSVKYKALQYREACISFDLFRRAALRSQISSRNTMRDCNFSFKTDPPSDSEDEKAEKQAKDDANYYGNLARTIDQRARVCFPVVFMPHFKI